MDATTIGLDIGKSSFQVHGVDASGAVVSRRKLPRSRVLAFFSGLPPAVVGIEACGAAQHWAREITALGHRVRLIPARAVKAYLPRQKNDAADAAAICEAAGRAAVRDVPVKSAAGQAGLALLRVRELLVKSRTMLVNALRGHLAEFGVVAPRGREGVSDLAGRLSDPAVPALAREACEALVAQILRAGRPAPRSRGPAAPAPRLGPGQPAPGRDPRHRAAGRDGARGRRRPGAVPLGAGLRGLARPRAAADLDRRSGAAGQHHPHGRWASAEPARGRRLGAAQTPAPTRRHAASAAGGSALGRWALGLLARKPWRVAMVALANKLARIGWVVLTREAAYHPAGRPALAAG